MIVNVTPRQHHYTSVLDSFRACMYACALSRSFTRSLVCSFARSFMCVGERQTHIRTKQNCCRHRCKLFFPPFVRLPNAIFRGAAKQEKTTNNCNNNTNKKKQCSSIVFWLVVCRKGLIEIASNFGASNNWKRTIAGGKAADTRNQDEFSYDNLGFVFVCVCVCEAFVSVCG